MRTSGESGLGRLGQKVSAPAGPRAVIGTPTGLGVAGIWGGTDWVTISTARVPRGPRNAARNELPDEVGWLTGRPCRFQPSWPASQAASQIAIRGGLLGSGER